jgi:hypothetical protein
MCQLLPLKMLYGRIHLVPLGLRMPTEPAWAVVRAGQCQGLHMDDVINSGGA